ncbi:uncharacterized protein OCT59_022216 [Rhizophagus irregularis]|uniref:uncharacterized protein n=1 Tax=Rhizophagus irregularis TaxID=588596 RepID=UPI0033265EE7|nr:hypothetical protein OCT59_022216 [Rhizophagus irregularis]
MPSTDALETIPEESSSQEEEALERENSIRSNVIQCENRIKTISSFPFAHAKKVTRTFTFDTHKDAIYFFNGMKGKQFDEPKGSKVNYLIEIWDVL